MEEETIQKEYFNTLDLLKGIIYATHTRTPYEYAGISGFAIAVDFAEANLKKDINGFK